MHVLPLYLLLNLEVACVPFATEAKATPDNARKNGSVGIMKRNSLCLTALCPTMIQDNARSEGNALSHFCTNNANAAKGKYTVATEGKPWVKYQYHGWTP
jgi:hypothetical protein|tara:strand:- start:267 stop:566 length:300 start_codon:yes stop_codon:yes gene_type:complete